MELSILLISLIFVIALLVDYNRTVLFVAAWLLVLDSCVSPINKLSLLQFIVGFILVLYFINKREHSATSYPFWWCPVLIGISLLVTNIFSSESHWPSSIAMLISEFVFPFFLWNAIKDEKDVHHLVKYMFVFFMIFCTYGLFEAITGTNPLLKWMISSDLFPQSGESDRFRFGIKRIQSFLTLNGACGYCATSGFMIMLYLVMYQRRYVTKYIRWMPYLITALFLCMFFTGTRSVYVGFAAGALFFVRKSMFRYKYTYLIIVLCIIIIPFLSTFLEEIIESFVDTKSVGGSNTDMRQTQFETSLYFMERNLFVGNGIGFTFGYVREYFSTDIYGAESVWMPLMMDRGLIGVVTYAISFLIPLIYCIKNKIYIGFFLLFSFITLKTLTSAPGIGNGYFLTIAVIAIRIAMIGRRKSA